MFLSDSIKTMIGVLIIQFSAGFTGDWGAICPYILSYYYHNGAPIEIKAQTSSLLTIILIIPVTICLILSAKIGNKIGHVKIIKISAFIFIVAPLFSFFSFHFVMFTIFNLILPCSAFAMALVPLFTCMYSYYSQNKSVATAMSIGSFSIGAIVWNIAITLSINPDNIIPEIRTEDPNLNFFMKDIADKVPKSMNYAYLGSGILFLVGSLLINYNESYHDEANVENAEVSSPQNETKNEETKGWVQTEEWKAEQEEKSSIQVRSYLGHPIVVSLFLLNIFGSLFQSYIQLNIKLVYMSVLEDDHLISVGLMIIILSSAIFSIPWGMLADCKGPFYVILAFLVFDMMAKIFATIVTSKSGFIAAMVLLGSTDKTMLVVFAPIMIDCFGLKVATELLPLKGISGIISIIIAAIIGFIFSHIESETVLLGLCTISLLNIILGVNLANLISKHSISQKEPLTNEPVKQ